MHAKTFLAAFLLILGGASSAAAQSPAPVPATSGAATSGAATSGKIALYEQLMELNGVSRNIRDVVASTRDSTRLVIIDRAKLDTLTPAQEARFIGIADPILKNAEADLIASVAAAQAPGFSDTEIRQLIIANASPAAAKYNAAKFVDQDKSADKIQSYMVNAVVRIIKAYQTNDSGDTPIDNNDNAGLDPASLDREDLVRALYRVDGTDALIRHFVASQHMKLIIQEVANHIDFSTLGEDDKTRMAAIAAAAQTELEEAILNQSARVQAAALTSDELKLLVTAYDMDAQRKLSELRLSDDGTTDRDAELTLQTAQLQIVKAFEAGT